MDDQKWKWDSGKLVWSKKHLRAIATAWAVMCPLVAATIAPFSVLLDIPALAETWYSIDGAALPDPEASLVLSGVSLASAIFATFFLLVRFSVYEEYWVTATHLSVLCWVIKTCVGLTNLIVFGVLRQSEPGASLDEGYWCGVVSFVISLLVLLVLVFHWAVQFLHVADVHSLRIRKQGRQFMLNTLFFVLIIAISALIMSRIEGWSYLQGIYFSVCSFETVGFGDFYPTVTLSRVLAFPLDLLGIAQLTVIITHLMTFFSNISHERAQHSRMRFERERRRAEEQGREGKDPRSLRKEIEFLEEMNRRRDWGDQMQELGWSVGTFLTFWLVGALIFSKLEGWSYGIGLYFCYVFFLAIGYGDFYVQTPAGRVVFVVYSLLAVPIMTSFAVQTVASLFQRVSESRMLHQRRTLLERRHKRQARQDERDRKAGVVTRKVEEGKARRRRTEEREREEQRERADERETDVVSHAEYVQRFRKQLEERKSNGKTGTPGTSTPTPESSSSPPSRQPEKIRERAEEEEVEQEVELARRKSVQAARRPKSDGDRILKGEHLVDGVLSPGAREAGAIEREQLSVGEALRKRREAERKEAGGRRKEDDPVEIREKVEREQVEEDGGEASERADAAEVDEGRKHEPSPSPSPYPKSSHSPDPDPKPHRTSEQVGSDVEHGHEPSLRSEEAVEDEDAELTDEVLEIAAELERHARRLLINNFPAGSRPQILLRADWHVQLNEMRAVLRERAMEEGEKVARRTGEPTGEEQERMVGRVEEEAEMVLQPLSERETMEEVSRYRECFARLLVAGSELRKLKGRQRFIFERRKAMEDELPDKDSES